MNRIPVKETNAPTTENGALFALLSAESIDIVFLDYGKSVVDVNELFVKSVDCSVLHNEKLQID